ncbi:DUF6313 family protein [Streptomyces sp. NBC_00564]|uniref:DUF6313 family protein n=1 Tax=unclassified Streptomyces TaxID=2593676 RepID=UPI00324F474B|nr:DUF6313 family protein [Streptomyces sp. NBC_00564]
MASSSPQSALPTPPSPRLTTRLRHWWDSREALPRTQRWLIRGSPLILACAVLFVVNGFLIGWVNAYNVLLGITSPADVRPSWSAWPLSLAGWALLPALIGGVVGYVVTAQIDSHRTRDLAEILGQLHDRATSDHAGNN